MYVRFLSPPLWSCAVAAACLCWLGQPAPARANFVNGQTFVANYQGVGPGVNLRIDVNGSEKNIDAGIFNWTTLSLGSGNFSFDAFCIQANNSLNDPQGFKVRSDLQNMADLTESNPSNSLLRATRIEDLLETYFPGFTSLTATGSTSVNEKAAGFQLAVWEILYDYNGTAGSLNLDSGYFEYDSGNSDAYTYAKSLLNGTASALTTRQGWILFGLEGHKYSTSGPWWNPTYTVKSETDGQSQLGIVAGDGGYIQQTAVPCPPAVWLVGSGVLTLLGYGRVSRRPG